MYRKSAPLEIDQNYTGLRVHMVYYQEKRINRLSVNVTFGCSRVEIRMYTVISNNISPLYRFQNFDYRHYGLILQESAGG